MELPSSLVRTYIATLYLGTESKSTTSLLESISPPESFCTSSLQERLGHPFVVYGVSGLSELSAYGVSREKGGDARQTGWYQLPAVDFGFSARPLSASKNAWPSEL
jgi:hypothetical protein